MVSTCNKDTVKKSVSFPQNVFFYNIYSVSSGAYKKPLAWTQRRVNLSC